jgi:nucleotide-binding universal stress UspA family protein
MFRAVLIALKPAASGGSLINFASELAARRHLEVFAYSVIDTNQLSPPEPVPLGASAFKLQRDEQRLAEARNNAEDACAALATACRAKSIPCTTRVPEGSVVQLLASESHLVDLLLCGHASGGNAGERSLLYSILKHNPRPAIVVPQAPSSGESVLVAYDGSAQAARALASFAHSGLADGRIAYVMSLHHDLEQANSLAQIGTKFLTRHGIHAVANGQQLGHSIADQILEEVSRIGAGLIVMGAFGQSAAREFFFGSVTRRILDSLPAPVFLDH